MSFARSGLVLGAQGLERLAGARVAVVGLGAVGGFAAEALARSGVGSLLLVDADVVTPTNLNRQLLALTSTMGRPKAEVARDRVLDINPHCRVDARVLRVDASNAAELLDPLPDALVDAIDDLGGKEELLLAARDARVPLVVAAMGAATRLDHAHVSVADLAATTTCPLARLLRRRLRLRGLTTGVRCVFSTEPPRNTGMSSKARDDAAASPVDGIERGRGLTPMGSLPFATAVFGLVAAREVVLTLAGRRDLLDEA